MDDGQIPSLLEKLSFEVVMLSPSNRGTFDRVREMLSTLSKMTDVAEQARLLAEQAIGILNGVSDDETSCANDLKRLNALLAEIQQIEASKPDASGAASGDVIDDNLRLDFLNSQDAAVQDFEADCLAFISGDAPKRAAIMRQLHTWKGEAGLLGFDDLAKAMHTIESAVQSKPDLTVDRFSDAMLAVKDQVASYFQGKREKDPAVAFNTEAVLELFEDKPEPAVVQAAPPAIEAPTVFPLPDDIDLDLVKDFLNESAEHIQSAEAALMVLEITPADSESINTVFRAFHTVKGVASFVGVSCITEFAHKAEAFFDRVRKGQLTLQGAYTDLSFEALDVLRSLLKAMPDAVETGQLKAPDQYARVRRHLENPESMADAPTSASVATAELTPSAIPAIANQTVATETVVPSAAAAPVESAPVQPAETTAAKPAEGQKTGSNAAKNGESDTTVKVNTSRLDNLINMVGELVIAQSMVSQDPIIQSSSSQRLVRNVAQLAKITRSLQELALSMRMVSVKGSFQKMARLVRDLARKSNKEIEFETDGEDTELDRNMVEAIADPLVHMVRNAVDHGVEPPADRVANGKGRQGHVRLSAAHEGGSVVITLKDDGRGLNVEKILKKAIERNLVSPNDNLTESEIFQLIWLPGFSTAEKVTDVSGRGVGMDVVRTNIEALRGTVDISSQVGQGTTFRVRLPLTLAIIDGMVVRAGEERFIVPTIAITESVQAEEMKITVVQGRTELINLRGDLVPICRLNRLFHIQKAIEDLQQGILVVVESKGRRAALLVDELMGQQQVVIKSLGSVFTKVKGISGGAILGDGRVNLILDVDGLIEAAGQYRA